MRVETVDVGDYNRIQVEPVTGSIGAEISNVDLRDIDDEIVGELRQAWLDHKVLSFPDQKLSDDQLARFPLYFGPYGDDPFFAPIDGHPRIAAIERRADETSPLFAENWHADWSFQEFNRDPISVMDFLEENDAGNTSTPHRQNRALLFDSMLFHQSDPFRFKKGGYGAASVDDRKLYTRCIYNRPARAAPNHINPSTV